MVLTPWLVASGSFYGEWDALQDFGWSGYCWPLLGLSPRATRHCLPKGNVARQWQRQSMATKKMATAIKRRNSWKNAIFLWNCHLFIWKKIKALLLHLVYTRHNLPMCTFKGQSLYWHFIRPLLLSAITQGVNPWKTYTRLFWHNGSRRSEVTITSWRK